MSRENEALNELLAGAQDQHNSNVQKWGRQDLMILNVALQEEVGEIAHAYLHYISDQPDENALPLDLVREIRHATALLFEMYLAAEELRGELTRGEP